MWSRGMTGKVDNHYGKLLTGVVLGSVIGAGAQVATGGQGAPNVPPTFGQLAVSGAATTINQSAQQMPRKTSTYSRPSRLPPATR